MGATIDPALTSLLFIAFGGWQLWRGWRELGHARASTAWPCVSGEVVGTELRETGRDEDGEVSRRAVITYRYTVDGAGHEGTRVFFGDGMALRFAGPSTRRLAAYPAGRAVQVAYDPADPGRAVLEPGAGAAAYLSCLVPAAVALLGVHGLLAGG
jgi:hypothetical protein